MANLIEQMNVLKGLTDEHLAGEVKAPSGSAPPFLVLSELNRRKDMRQRYEQDAARRAPRSTVAEDLASSLPVGANGSAPGLGGIGPDTAPPGFAEGGIVDYSDIADKYNERLEGLGGDRDRARAMALLAAAGGILSAGHSNTLSNIGAGITAGTDSYTDALKTIDTDELNLLRGITDIGQAQSADELAMMDRDFRERSLAQDQSQFDATAARERLPAAAREAEWYADPNTTQAQRDAYDANKFNPNAVTNDTRLIPVFDAAEADAAKMVGGEPTIATPGIANSDPNVTQANLATAMDKWRRDIMIASYQTIKRRVSDPMVAVAYAQRAGLTADEILAADAATAGVSAAPPSGAPASGAVSYTDYFN